MHFTITIINTPRRMSDINHKYNPSPSKLTQRFINPVPKLTTFKSKSHKRNPGWSNLPSVLIKLLDNLWLRSDIRKWRESDLNDNSRLTRWSTERYHKSIRLRPRSSHPRTNVSLCNWLFELYIGDVNVIPSWHIEYRYLNVFFLFVYKKTFLRTACVHTTRVIVVIIATTPDLEFSKYFKFNFNLE